MDLFEDIKNLSEARDLLAMIQNQPQVICEQYGIEMDDMYAVEEEVTARINAIEEKDIKKFCEYKLDIINYSNARMSGISIEIERLQSLLMTEQKKSEKAKKSIDWILKITGTEKLETKLNNLSYRKFESVSILDEKLIPEEYRKIKEVKNVDKIGIKDALKNGKDVPGASIQINQNLQIK